MKGGVVMYKQTCIALAVALYTLGLCPALVAQNKTFDDVITINTDMVIVRATVTDRSGKAVTDLRKNEFRITEDGVEQTIELFSPEAAPVSRGLVLDRSGSMMDMIKDVYGAALHVIDEGTSQDEVFILTFNDKTKFATRFSADRKMLDTSIRGLRADGGTALYDAIAAGLTEFRQARFRKKVLVVITDGEDNESRLKFDEILHRAQEDEAIIYTVGMFGGGKLSWYATQLERLAEATGGSAHFPTNARECRAAMDQIGLAVSQQYSFGYYSTNTNYDGSWRQLKLKINRPGSFSIAARRGYYAEKKPSFSR